MGVDRQHKWSGGGCDMEERGKRDRKRGTYPCIMRSMIRSCKKRKGRGKERRSEGKGEENDRAFITCIAIHEV
jgi:hypothetical protein